MNNLFFCKDNTFFSNKTRFFSVFFCHYFFSYHYHVQYASNTLCFLQKLSQTKMAGKRFVEKSKISPTYLKFYYFCKIEQRFNYK